MSIEATPRSNGEYETKPIISYEEYRELCDMSQPDVLRKTGIPSAEDYEMAQANPRTIYAEIDNRRAPLFTPLESVSGFNPESSSRLTESENIFVQSLPFEVIIGKELDVSSQLASLGENAAVIVETSSHRTDDIQAEVAQMNPEGGVYEFLDPRLKGDRQRASISLYAVSFDALDEEGNLIPKQDMTLREAFEQDRVMSGNGSVELIEPSQIREDEELFDRLWDLQDDRFTWLGKYHPVSMQENKDFFKRKLSDDHTESFINSENDGEGHRVSECHGCIMDPDQIEWFTDRFQRQMQESLDPETERIQFFYGIAGKSSSEKMAHLSKGIMGLDARLMKIIGGRTKLMFESTNMSSGYIPRMVSQYVGDEPNGVKQMGDIRTLSKLDYWYFKPHVQSQEQSYIDVAA